MDIYRLDYDAITGRFDVALATCVPDPPGGAHNATLSPNGSWLAISNCCSDWAIDVVDLRNIAAGEATVRYRIIDEGVADTARCPAGAPFKCIVVKKPNGSSARGLWRPHDVFFSKDGYTIYVAAINSTWIVDVKRVLSGTVKPIAVILNNTEPGGVDNVHNVSISHQADTTADGKILIVSDERGGGLTEAGCNTGAGGVIGGLHFFALAELKGVPQSKGASLSNPKKLGDYFTPNPLMTYDPLQAILDSMPRLERACTIHVFRLGGNGSVSPGPIQTGYDGVSEPGASRADLRALRGRHVAPRHLRSGQLDRRDRRGPAHDLGQHPRLDRDAGRRHVGVEGVQGPRLRDRHGSRLRRVPLRRLRRRGVRRPERRPVNHPQFLRDPYHLLIGL